MRDFITSASSFAGMPKMENIDIEKMTEEERTNLKF